MYKIYQSRGGEKEKGNWCKMFESRKGDSCTTIK